MTPPPIIHAIRILHKDLYYISNKISKPDKIGIHANVLTQSIKILKLAVETAFKPRELKRPILEILRVEIEILKHLIRTENELCIIDAKTYLRLAEQLVEISKMTNGWIGYTHKGA